MRSGLVLGIFLAFWSRTGTLARAGLFSLECDPRGRAVSTVINDLALDRNGDIIVVGSTSSPRFPGRDLFHPSPGGDYDGFIVRLSPDGSAILSSTYLGGSGEDRARSVAIDSRGRVWVAGYTDSDDFPLRNPLQKLRGGSRDAFLVLASGGLSEIVFSTYLGGGLEDAALDLAVTVDDEPVVLGETLSADFPTRAAYQPVRNGQEQDLFLTKLNPLGSVILFSSYLGGDAAEFGGGLALGPEGDVFVSGTTWSDNFPARNCFQDGRAGKCDAFVTRFDHFGSRIIYSTYLGGDGFDFGSGCVVDREGGLYLAGTTLYGSFPLVDPLLEYEDEEGDAFLARISPSGSELIFSTRYGGQSGERGRAVALDGTGGVCLLGMTDSHDFPLHDPVQAAKSGEFDIFFAWLRPSLGRIDFSTYLGGDEIDSPRALAVDKNGSAVLAGYTYSYNFPVRSPLLRTLPKGGGGVVVKLAPSGSSLDFSTYLGGELFLGGASRLQDPGPEPGDQSRETGQGKEAP